MDKMDLLRKKGGWSLKRPRARTEFARVIDCKIASQYTNRSISTFALSCFLIFWILIGEYHTSVNVEVRGATAVRPSERDPLSFMQSGKEENGGGGRGMHQREEEGEDERMGERGRWHLKWPVREMAAAGGGGRTGNEGEWG